MLGRLNKVTSGLAALLLIGMAGCVDLEVQNPNAPDASRALATAGDVEALIAGAYGSWDNVMNYGSAPPWMSNASGLHAAPWANTGMEQYARIPRIPTNNIAGASDVETLTYTWYRAYRAVAAVHDGLKQIADGAVTLGTDDLRAQAYGKFMQGLAHATIAIMYDSGFVYDETIDPATVTLQDYTAVMTAARGYFDDAITLASSGSFTIPSSWFSVSVSSADLVKMAHSEKARMYASVARTPAERQGLDWTSIKADANAGFIASDWSISDCATGSAICQDPVGIWLGWAMQNNWVSGMADQSGNYQTWVSTPLGNKMPFLVITPDTRWPQGANEAAQLAANGEFYHVNKASNGSRIWARPDRGTWRWSYYYNRNEPYYTFSNVNYDGDIVPTISAVEMQALVAEADFYAGNMGNVATFVNTTRTTHGLAATDAAGTNTDCVPKLPNGSCGNLWEMFKWEKRLETQFDGVLRISWYFDGRGWGDLLEGTIIQLPVPYGEMQLLQQKPYNYGGVGGQFGAPVGTYSYGTYDSGVH